MNNAIFIGLLNIVARRMESWMLMQNVHLLCTCFCLRYEYGLVDARGAQEHILCLTPHKIKEKHQN